jgi:hypothetical protein
MLAVKLDADAASGDWTLDALVSRHGSFARMKYSRPRKPCARRAERPGSRAVSTCAVQEESDRLLIKPSAVRALEAIGTKHDRQRFVARINALSTESAIIRIS